MDARRRAALGLSCFYASLGHPLRVPGVTLAPERLWRAPVEQVRQRLHLSDGATRHLSRFRRRFDHERAVAALERVGVTMIVYGEQEYPRLLAEIFDPPMALFIRGEAGRLEEFTAHPRISIVGSRAASSYGIDAAHLLGTGLARAGVCIISGMAAGIDAAAHKAALPEPGGTIAVLGCGPDVIYPRFNRSIYGQLLERGLVVSEYPPGTEPRPWRFPARNRIIAGLSDGVIVVEAAERSGALITAEFGLEAGREVFAVPGSIFEHTSSGANSLIQSGAAMAVSADDVLEVLGFGKAADAVQDSDADIDAGLEAEAAKLMRALGKRPLPLDVVSQRTGIGVGAALECLTRLELEGRVRYETGRGYSR